MAASRRVRIALLTALVAPGCIPSNVVAKENRAVELDDFEIEIEGKPWSAPTADAIPGVWRSFRITGDAAASLAEIAYSFGQAGTYSGAALSFGAELPTFEVLQGTWAIDDRGFVLDGEPVACRVREGVLEFEAPAGAVYLRRIALR
ncbi:MAG: hypothetical protein H6832_12475 [Planctomycetes bacterium]|nr:hypothetical protein [Planctomycetota bacterium]